ncbi:D-alanyl-D-alanine carboxypeptidase [Rhodoblastus acidophilus]|uniref:D-alanyl-D-alanine carboxypeptidase n=1 Tax=Rhodoblastus acidophilus TaxID=1074 RepID=A0A6N8DRG6_RHOAC|nr:serine hydrolase [Rhodoblastus acidophilus]MCW2276235.1 D-alanyl-D-alanine carboxypeptidase [Rhodoblastus acidophilus]MTV32898.1 D-alanyl-D-alanine carboxypeptidase [Rhodoblastus acidophilus]
MFQSILGGPRYARATLSGFVIALVAATSLATPAEARRHHHHGGHRVHANLHAHHHLRHARPAAVAGSATAAIAVDGATGHVLWGMNEHAPRHPASVTKVMTLYLLFEQLEKGKLSLDDAIPISAHAAAQAPSKLGLRPGSSIRVEDAIKVVVTKSANDIAVAIAEAVGGTESDFAEMMTRKAHALGMSRTLYRNASGLPNSEQITTAFDLAILGRDIQARFPRYYRYFSLHEVSWHGQRIHNHNHLMDRVEGMDGIKTGYTAASGFNLLSSVKRDGHYLISVVMGGKSARSRDAYMERVIEAHIDDAGGRGAVQVASRDADEEAEARAEPAPEPRRVAEPKPEPKPEPRPEPRVTERAAPEPPRLQLAAVLPDPRPRPAYVAAAPQPPRPEERPTARPAVDGSTRKAQDGAGAATPGGMRWLTGAPARPTKLETRIEIKPTPKAQETEGVSEKGKDKIASAKPAVSGWILQIGATDDADKAEALLKSAREKRAALLGGARGYTEAVHKGRETLYRARFAGLEESRAEAACKALKSSGFSCFAMRN